MRITRISTLIMFFICGLPFSCVITPCGLGGSSPELQIIDFEILTGYYSQPDNGGLIFPEEFDTTKAISYKDIVYKLQPDELIVAALSEYPSAGFAAYACSPPPTISVDSISSVTITSIDTLWFANSTFSPGEELNDLFLPAYYDSWEQFYSLSKTEIIDYGLDIEIVGRPDKDQIIELSFEIIMEDGRDLNAQSKRIKIN